ncbi:MAG: helix-turn-helix transcriptional regulator [Candidatus Limnocylindrales bacterium]
MRPKPPLNGHQRRGHRRARAIRQDLGAEVAALRESSGLSMRALALAAGISPSTQAAIEAGTHSPSIEVLARVADALGARLGVRLFPGTGPHIFDHLQAGMLKALLQELHSRWDRRLEVPVYGQARGVIDLVLEDARERVVVACEAQSQLRRLEQQVRWASMKADALAQARHSAGARHSAQEREQAEVVSRLLLLRSTQSNRHVVSEFGELLMAAYPARYADLIAALTGTAPWPGSGLAWCAVDGDGTRILERPPRGIRLGR